MMPVGLAGGLGLDVLLDELGILVEDLLLDPVTEVGVRLAGVLGEELLEVLHDQGPMRD